MILREASILLGIGLVAGTALALYAMRAADKLLFNLHANDPASLAISAAALATVAAAASYFPARRAARLDPMAALSDGGIKR